MAPSSLRIVKFYSDFFSNSGSSRSVGQKAASKQSGGNSRPLCAVFWYEMQSRKRCLLGCDGLQFHFLDPGLSGWPIGISRFKVLSPFPIWKPRDIPTEVDVAAVFPTAHWIWDLFAQAGS